MSPFKRLLLIFMVCMVGQLLRAFEEPTFTKVLPLKPEEGVFAYARVTSDGKLLAYASEKQSGNTFLRTTNVVDLETKKVIFSEPGIDSYWSPDGKHLIFLSIPNPDEPIVCIWNRIDGSVQRNVAPASLGHYFTWGKVNDRDLILTQENYYYFIEKGKALRPYRKVPAFPPLGTGEQPMISRDGKSIVTFYRGTVMVRRLDEPGGVVETCLPGGKGDFSFDGRYVAFHSMVDGSYQIRVVDLLTREFIEVTDFPGSCYYPSWTKDGRLVFRYDSPDYRGFMMASNFLNLPRTPLPTSYPNDTSHPGTLADLVGRSPLPKQKVVMVNFWAGWCVHCRGELPVLNQIRKELKQNNLDAEIIGACDPTSFKTDREFILKRSNFDLPQIDIGSVEVNAFGIQVYPSTLIFVDQKLMEKHNGALTRSTALTLLKKHGIRIGKE